MRRVAWTLVVAAAALVPAIASAQDARDEKQPAASQDEQVLDDKTVDAVDQAERRSLRVLENPYDIASFYRSSTEREQEGYTFGGYVDSTGVSDYGHGGHYAIAGFYRNHQQGAGGYVPMAPYGPNGPYGYGYSAFWSRGYGGYGRGAAGAGAAGARGGYPMRYRGSMGHNGEVYLVSPLLAPYAPLMGAYRTR